MDEAEIAIKILIFTKHIDFEYVLQKYINSDSGFKEVLELFVQKYIAQDVFNLYKNCVLFLYIGFASTDSKKRHIFSSLWDVSGKDSNYEDIHVNIYYCIFYVSIHLRYIRT